MAIPPSVDQATPSPVMAKPSFDSAYEANAAFVWRSLFRLGVRSADLDDACQETFLVAYRKFDQFQGGSMRAWLFTIASKVGADFRKRAHVRHEVLGDEPPEVVRMEGQGEAIDRQRSLAWLSAVLLRLDEEKRTVFMLYELEEMPMTEVAQAVGCPIQTAYSRLHSAREFVSTSIERWHRKEKGRS